jgi:hypothetical protein
VDVGAELFAMASTCSRAAALLRRDPYAGRRAVKLADVFCRQARARVRTTFRAVFRNADVPTYRVAQEVLAGEHEWLEAGMVSVPSRQ